MKALLLAALAIPLLAKGVNLTRATLTPVERSLDRYLTTGTADDPVDILGSTRAVYLEGYGAVFTTEIFLVATPSVNPFQPEILPATVKSIHDRKLKRLPGVRQAMVTMATSAARSLDSMPSSEQIVVAVRLLYFKWENTAGLPSQLMLKAERGNLLKKGGVEISAVTEEQ